MHILRAYINRVIVKIEARTETENSKAAYQLVMYWRHLANGNIFNTRKTRRRAILHRSLNDWRNFVYDPARSQRETKVFIALTNSTQCCMY